jgi:hypothetical protein
MPQVDWIRLLPRIDAVQQELTREHTKPNSLVALQGPAFYLSFRPWRVILAGLGVVLLIAGLWQAYRYTETSGEPAGPRIDSVQDDATPSP